MEGEARVLQERVEVVAVQRRVGQPQERVRGEQQEHQERDRDAGLHAQHQRLEALWQRPAPDRHGGPEDRQDQHPQQQRALVVPPDARDLVDHRLGGMRVGGHQLDREIRGHEGPGQRPEGQRHQPRLPQRRRTGHGHPVRPALSGADERNDHLQRRQHEGQDHGQMAKLCGHGAPPYWVVVPRGGRIKAAFVADHAGVNGRPRGKRGCRQPIRIWRRSSAGDRHHSTTLAATRTEAPEKRIALRAAGVFLEAW